MTSFPRQTHPPGFRRVRMAPGFSLVETTIAVAIAALGIVSLLGLLPQGMEMSRKTTNIAAESRIMQNIVSDLQASDWSQIASAAGIRTYDDQGVRLSSQADDTRWISYVAKVEFAPAGSTMPGAGAAAADPYLQRVIVRTAESSTPTFDFASVDSSRYKTRSFLLAKTH